MNLTGINVDDESNLDINDNSQNVVKFELGEVSPPGENDDDKPMSELGLSILPDAAELPEHVHFIGDQDGIKFQIGDYLPDGISSAENWILSANDGMEYDIMFVDDPDPPNPPDPVIETTSSDTKNNLAKLKDEEEISPAFSPMSDTGEEEADWFAGLQVQEDEQERMPILDYYGHVDMDYHPGAGAGDDKTSPSSSFLDVKDDNQTEAVEQFRCPFCLQTDLGREGLIDHLGDAHGLRLDSQEQAVQEPVISPEIPTDDEEQLDTVSAPDPGPDCEGAGNPDKLEMPPPPPPMTDEEITPSKNPASDPPANKCHLCGLTFNHSSILSKHMDIHQETGDRPWKCSKCPSFFKAIIQLRSHETRLHKIKKDLSKPPLNEVVSKSPLRKVVSRSAFKRDVSNSPSKEDVPTPSSKNDMSRHLCKVCGKSFHASYMEDHMLIHRKEKPFRCPMCPYSCRQLVHLRVHLISRHGIKKSNSQLRSFLQSSNLMEGVGLVEKGEQDKEPSTSRKTAPPRITITPQTEKGKKLGVKVKVQTQTGKFGRSKSKQKEEAFKCHRCKISFCSGNSLARHMKIHSEGADRPLKCSQCYAFFKTTSSVALHKNQVHNRLQGDSMYPCSVCQKLFSRGHLIIHMRTHNQKRSFPCPDCTQRFRELKLVQSHLLTVHGKNWSRSAMHYYSAKSSNKEVPNHPDPTTLEGIVHSYNGPDPESGNTSGEIGNETETGEDNGNGRDKLEAVRAPPSGSMKNRCSICKKRFPNRVTMIVHMRIHNEEESHEHQLELQNMTVEEDEESTPELNSPLQQSQSSSSQVTPPTPQLTPTNIILTPDEDHWIAAGFPLRPCRVILARCDNLIPNYAKSPASTTASMIEGDKTSSSIKLESFIQVVRHAGKKMLKCTECRIILRDKSKALRHVAGVHMKIRPYQCPHCLLKFSYKDNFKRHLQRRHSSAPAPLRRHNKCPKCSKIFVNRSNLRRHIIQLHKEKVVQIG